MINKKRTVIDCGVDCGSFYFRTYFIYISRIYRLIFFIMSQRLSAKILNKFYFGVLYSILISLWTILQNYVPTPFKYRKQM